MNKKNIAIAEQTRHDRIVRLRKLLISGPKNKHIQCVVNYSKRDVNGNTYRYCSFYVITNMYSEDIENMELVSINHIISEIIGKKRNNDGTIKSYYPEDIEFRLTEILNCDGLQIEKGTLFVRVN